MQVLFYTPICIHMYASFDRSIDQFIDSVIDLSIYLD